MDRKELRIGSRDSALAVVQAAMLEEYLKKERPEIAPVLVTMKTTGDKILDRRLDQIGGKGLFVKELDLALRDKRTDVSVHSLKDLPMEVPEDLPLLGCSAREDPRDVLVLPEGVSEPDLSLPIGTSSPRRILQLKQLYPQARFESVRGNLQTRLRKLDEGKYAALVLAAAGMKRMGLAHRISRYFSVEEIIPAAGQGILGLQGRKGEDYACLQGFCDEKAGFAAACERAFVARLDGGCSSPIAAHAIVSEMTECGGEQLADAEAGQVCSASGRYHVRLLGLYCDEQTGNWVRGEESGECRRSEEAAALGEKLADRLKGGDTSPVSPSGKVWLVGAGPGDPGLFTLKGKQVLEQADVVVYDALVGQGVLGMIPKEARCINVGKRAANHIMPQEEINQVLLREALAGRRVVRLKGGDPFLFGRGGEELELLVKNGVPFEIVPGITSAVAVPAYNGIPVTHRDFCSSVHIITGHKRQGASYDIDFDALVRTGGTLVFLMGLGALEDICRELLGAGMDPDMPAAVLQQGTTARQKRVVAPLRDLVRRTKEEQIRTPAIIVVGRVCSLADEFAWVEKRPLAGRRILVTRPKELVSEMARKLREQGAEVLELPAIRTVAIPEEDAAAAKEAADKPTEGKAKGMAAGTSEGTAGGAAEGTAVLHLEEILRGLTREKPYDWIVFTSPTGVRIFMEKLFAIADIRLLAGSRLAAIGAGTAKALKGYGLKADFIPSVYDGETLGRELADKCRPGMRLLIPRAAIGNPELVEELLKTEGITVTDVATYDTLYEASGIINERSEFEQGNIDYAVFTSASTVRGFVQATQGLDYSLVKAVCIGRQTRAAAEAAGMQTWMSGKATMDSLVEAVIRLASGGAE